MSLPVIGITVDSEQSGGYSKFPWYALRENYSTAVTRAGGLPTLLPNGPIHVEDFLDRIDAIRKREPQAAFRSNFIVGYPGETETDHDQLLDFIERAQLDWCGFFAYSEEVGTYAVTLDGAVDSTLRSDRLAELRELQDGITAARRDVLIGTEVEVLVDES